MSGAAERPTLVAELRSLPRAYWILVGGWFVNRFGTFVMPFLTLLLDRQGRSAGEIAHVLCAYGVGQFSASVLGGYFSDKIGRRAVLVAGTLGNAASVFAVYFLIASPHSLWAIAGMMMLAGFASGFYMPASNALLADIVPAPLRLRAYSAQRLAINAGFAFGTSAAGFLITVSTFALFAGDALTTALFGIIAWRLLPRGHRVTGSEAEWREAWRVLRGDRAFWGLFVGTVFSSFIFQQFGTTYGLEVKQRGLSLWALSPEQTFGMLLAWNGVMVALFELPLTRWTQRFESRAVIIAGYLMQGFGFGMNAFGGGIVWFAAGMTLFTTGEMLSQPMRSAYIAEIAPLHLRGRYMGALAMASTAAGMFGPHINLRLHAWNPTVLWLGCAVLGVLAALSLGLGRRDAAGR